MEYEYTLIIRSYLFINTKSLQNSICSLNVSFFIKKKSVRFNIYEGKKFVKITFKKAKK